MQMECCSSGKTVGAQRPLRHPKFCLLQYIFNDDCRYGWVEAVMQPTLICT